MSIETKEEPAEFLEEERPGVTYVKPSLEMKLTSVKKDECREIVREIKSFGVSQRQLLFIIDLLALELENNEATRAIKAAVSGSRENMEKEPAGLILPTGIIR